MSSMPSMSLIYLKTSEIKKVKKELLEKQNYTCPILKVKLSEDEAVLDHKHSRKGIPLGENYNGLVRGAINRWANALEGKIINFYIRSGLEKTGVPLPDILRNLADYLENPPADPIYVHPTEVPKPKKLGKRAFKKLNEAYKEKYPRRKELEYPKRGVINKRIQEIANELGIEL